MRANMIESVRQNHSLEHATIALLVQKLGGHVRLAGRSTANGFYVYGDVPTDKLEESAHEALERLRSGQSDLAISAFCGTNLVVSGLMAATASMVALGGRNRWQRLPNAVLAAVSALVLAQPLGRLAQKYITTTPDTTGLRIVKVSRNGFGPFKSHKVETARG